MSRQMVYLDFEYSESASREVKRLVAVGICVRGEIFSFNLTDSKDRELAIRFIRSLMKPDQYIFSCFSLDAEFNSLLHLHIDTYCMDWIDWAVEAKMIVLTHPKKQTKDYSLLSACRMFGIKHRYAGKKDEARDLILTKASYTEEEMNIILDYCESDIEVLPQLASRILSFDNRVTIEHRINRGHFCKANSYALFHTKGLPIDRQFLNDIFDKKEAILSQLYNHANEVTAAEIFFYKEKEKKWGFRRTVFNQWLYKEGLYKEWKKTKSGRMASTKAEDFERILMKFLSNRKMHEKVGAIHNAKQTAISLNSTDYRTLLTSTNHIKPVNFPFNQKTGRSSPKPKMGFALNLQPWMRRMILIPPGEVLISADWGKQEIAIAAWLSKDPNFLKDYQTDIYVETAKMCGLIPKDGTKHTHPDIRQKFKSITLGMGYGKMEEGVSDVLQVEFGYDKSTADRIASRLFATRELRYALYYHWIRTLIEDTRTIGVYKTLDNWFYYAGWETRRTQLQNLPMQSNGAAIMRRGFIRSVESGLDVVCSLHDALYISSTPERAEDDVKKLRDAMQGGVVDILGEGIEIENDVHIYYPGERFKDRDGRDVSTLIKLGEYDKSFIHYL